MHSTFQSIALGAAALVTLADCKPLAPYRPEGTSLKKRAVTEVICGLYSTADIVENGENRRILEGKGGTVAVSANSCSRIGCIAMSGMYVCNDQSEDIEIDMSEVIEQHTYMTTVCVGGNSIGKDAVSGRVKVDTHGGWNLNIGYCNGNDPTNIPPNGYKGPGPNGDPAVVCGLGDQPSCEGGNCKADSIVINEQKTVTCQSYLGASYVGAGANQIYNTNRQISTTWNVGGWLGIDTSDLASIAGNGGFGGGFSETTVTGSTAGISDPCGDPDVEGDFTCGMHIKPQCFEMSGTCIDSSNDDEVPWANVVPQVSEDDIGVYFSEACTCGNCLDSDNLGAPDLCELECTVEC